MIPADEAEHWLSSATTGKRFFDVSRDGKASFRGAVVCISNYGILALIDAQWDDEAEEWEALVEGKSFFPWASLIRIGEEHEDF